MSVARVLAIPSGKDCDGVGRKVGDDWLLATLGADHDGTTYYVTTDSVHASEYGLLRKTSPAEMAKALADFVNRANRPSQPETVPFGFRSKP